MKSFLCLAGKQGNDFKCGSRFLWQVYRTHTLTLNGVQWTLSTNNVTLSGRQSNLWNEKFPLNLRESTTLTGLVSLITSMNGCSWMMVVLVVRSSRLNCSMASLANWTVLRLSVLPSIRMPKEKRGAKMCKQLECFKEFVLELFLDQVINKLQFTHNLP